MLKFEKEIQNLTNTAEKINVEALNAISLVTKKIQTKYPELTAIYSYSDQSIIYINDLTMEEYYELDQIYDKLGKKWKHY